jgi:hypothetical protein
MPDTIYPERRAMRRVEREHRRLVRYVVFLLPFKIESLAVP